MNSLELIKSEIYDAKTNLEKFTKLQKNEPKNTNYSFYKTYFTNRLTILQQIKAELEAWEVIKKCIIDSSGVYLLRIDSDDEDDIEYYETIKKALEVEDER